MKRFHDLIIYQKIVIVVLSVVFVLGLLSSVVIWDSLSDLMGQQLQRRGVEIGYHVASLSTNHIIVDDRYALHELIHEMKLNTEDVKYILVTDHQGWVLAHTFPVGMPKGLRELNVSRKDAQIRVVPYDSDEGQIQDILVPIEEGAVGYIRIGMAEEGTKGIIGRTLKKYAVIILGVCLLAVVLAAKMARLITAPISKLVQVSQAITQGKLTVKADVGRNDEIGKLATAFNEMASGLAATNSERDALVGTLQEKEYLRTTLLNKLITAQEDERRHISRELHDETGQSLTWLVMSMRALADKATDAKQREVLLTARDIASELLNEIRDMAVELRPPVLDDLGVVAAMKKYLATYQQRFDITVKFSATQEINDLDKQIAVALYRILQESLTNIVRHSKATVVDVNIDLRQQTILMQITDNGRGIADAELEQAVRQNRLGIYGMKERAELLNGTFQITSSPQRGTTITVSVPLYYAKGKCADGTEDFIG